MVARGQLQILLCMQLKVGHYSNFTITFPTLWRCAGDNFRVSLKFKMAVMDQLYQFWWHKDSKIEVINNSQFITTLPTIWNCAGDFTEIQNGPHKSNFSCICDRKNSNLFYGRG